LDFNIRTPRIIPSSAAVWSIIELGKKSDLQDMVTQNVISPFDVNPLGRSLLRVREIPSGFAVPLLIEVTQYAALKGQNEIYKVLLSLKADPYFRDQSGM
jgi:hypothetical protein